VGGVSLKYFNLIRETNIVKVSYAYFPAVTNTVYGSPKDDQRRPKQVMSR
jgi:hypothetical protein